MMHETRPTETPKSGKSWLIRLGLMFIAVLVSLGLAEIALRVSGFEFHLYPTTLQFGYPDTKTLDDFFERHDDYLWVSGRARKKIDAAWANPPHLILSGCSCTEWGGFDEAIARRVAETPGLAPLTYGNFASSGWSSFQGLMQMKLEIAKLKPKVVTIYYGWNDHWMGFGVDDKTAATLSNSSLLDQQNLRVIQFVTKAIVTRGENNDQSVGENARPDRVSPNDFRSNLMGMVEVARANGITPVLITAPTSHIEGEEPPHLRGRFMQDVSQLVPIHRAYVDIVREVAANQEVILCDLAAAFDALPREEVLSYMNDDGIHFKPEGGEKVGELLFATLFENDLFERSDGQESGDGQ